VNTGGALEFAIILDECRYISETIEDRRIVTIED